MEKETSHDEHPAKDGGTFQKNEDTPDDASSAQALDDKEEENGLRYFLVIAGICLLVIAGLVLIPRWVNKGPVTLDDLHKANLAGKKLSNAYVYNSFSFVYYDQLWYTQILNQYTGDIYDVPLHY